MKVKKPQSKRKSTRLQKGIQKKIAAHTRKQKKLSKKDVTWKSRHPKDPGIPNSFPFKAQLLEEMEQQKQRDIEAREARREQMRAQARQQGASEEQIQQLEIQQDVHESQNRLGALMQSVTEAASSFAHGINGDEDEMMVDEANDSEDEAAANLDLELGEAFTEISQDSSRKAFEKHFKQVLDTCDVLIYVLDARNPDGTRSKHVEQTILANPNRRLLFALNKVDLVPSDVLTKWVKHLSMSFPTIPLNASSAAANAHTFEHEGLNRVNTSVKLLDSLKKYAQESKLGRAITVGVVGYPNVGKSSVINALTNRNSGANTRACPVGAQAGVTTDVRRVKVDNKLHILDCPGICFPSASKKGADPIQEQARLILLNAMPPKYMDDCRPAVNRLVKRLMKNDMQFQHFMNYYDIPATSTADFERFMTSVLVHVARKLGRLGKGGIPDLGAAALAVVVDWRDGRLAGWAEPPAEKKADTVEVVNTWAQEFNLDDILSGLM